MDERALARSRAARVALANQFRADRFRARCRADRTRAVRAWRNRAADGWLWSAAIPARQRWFACGKRTPVGRAAVSTWTSSPAGPLRGELRVPGDKSISHRAIMFASLAEGTSRISGFLEGEDTRATARAFAQMGVSIEAPKASERIVHGVGLHGLRASSMPI